MLSLMRRLDIPIATDLHFETNFLIYVNRSDLRTTYIRNKFIFHEKGHPSTFCTFRL